MEISLLDKSDEGRECAFIMKGISVEYANTLRRIFIEEVPTLAIEVVDFKKNNSILYDEMLAHRMGLVPLTTDLSMYEMPPADYKSVDELSAKQKVTLTLKAKGPCTVYSSDLKSKDPSVKPVFDKIPLVKLMVGQELELEATAILGKGRTHAKWSPCLAYYKQKPIIKVGKKVENAKEVIQKQPEGIFILKGGSLVVDNDMILKSNLVEEAVKLCEPKGSVSLDYSDDEIIYYIESWGQLSVQDLMKEGLKQLDKITDEFTKVL